MSAGERQIRVPGWAVVGSALLVCAVAVPAVSAKGKGKSTKSFAGKSLTVPLAAGLSGSATATCPSKTHATGGGYSVSPAFNPSALTGVRSVVTESIFSAKRTWRGTASAYASPPQAGTLTTRVQCESDLLIKRLLSTSTPPTAIPVDTLADVNLTCPAGTQVLSGGYTLSPPPSLTDPTMIGAFVLASRRTAPNQWTITVLNPTPPVGVATATITGVGLCEKSKSGKVSEVSSVTAIGSDARSVGQASCSKRKHVVSGGFDVSPHTAGASSPAVSVDESESSGDRTWKSGLYELPGPSLPAGSTLTTFAYCKKS
jgi:hypothetical protein